MKSKVRLLMVFVGLTPAGISVAQQHPLDVLFDNLSDTNASVEERNAASRKILEFARVLDEGGVDQVRKAIPVLLRRLEYSEPSSKMQASAMISGLFYLRPNALSEWDGDVEELYKHFEDPDPRVRENLVRAIAMAKPSPPPAAAEHLLKRLSDGSSRVQPVALLGLLRLEPPPEEAIDAIAKKLRETKDPGVLANLINYVGFSRTRNQTVIAGVIGALDAKDLILKMSAVRALVAAGPAAKAALPRLRGLLEQGGLGLENESMIRSAIRRIGGG